MKLTIVSEEKKQMYPTFPCIRKHKESGCIALFTNVTEAILLTSDGVNPAGTASDSFVEYNDVKFWEVVNDITINFKMD